MGETKSRKQTEQAAIVDAKKKAAEFTTTHIKSETQVKDLELEKDLVEAFANGTVKVIQEIENGWYKDQDMGDCYKVKIKAEVVPDEQNMDRLSKTKQTADNPSAPLNVKIWTKRHDYKAGEKIKVYLKGNKPFYARVLYKDAGDNLVQLLPNPYRSDNYFNGGVIYEVPSGTDKFDLEVSPPYGQESVVVYASTEHLGEISLRAQGGIYQVMTKPADIGKRHAGSS